tara:strand:- start:680 stop:1192 length:513 start_codon:yes stop_codon:yes gene_type:complete
MAIKDTSRKPYIVDNDTNVFVGLDLPIRKSLGKEGYFASTSTTIEAVKNNIRNLLNTNPGERLMHPTLGLNLRNFLFNQINEDTVVSIQNSISETLGFWLPFVLIKDIQIATNADDTTVGTTSIVVNIIFSIQQDPNTLDAVQLAISNTAEQSQLTLDSLGGEGSSGGGY